MAGVDLPVLSITMKNSDFSALVGLGLTQKINDSY